MFLIFLFFLKVFWNAALTATFPAEQILPTKDPPVMVGDLGAEFWAPYP